MSPLEFRFHVAMQGVLGIGGNIAAVVRGGSARSAARPGCEYKAIRPLVQHGRQYWLRPPAALGSCGVQYVAHDGRSTAVLLYQVRGVLGRGARRFALHGLLPDARYVRESDGLESTGGALMSAGLPGSAVGSGDWRSSLQVWRAD